MDTKAFLIQHMLEEKSYKEIEQEFNISRAQLIQWWEEGSDDRKQINKAKQIFNNKKDKEEFREFLEMGKKRFFEWYEKQERKCHYCEIEAWK